MNKWEKIGECDVDSGQLMIIDPCYANSLQLQEKEYVDFREYKDKDTGKKYQYKKGEFKTFDSIISEYDCTPNDLIQKGIWVESDTPHPNAKKEGEKESYASISHGTLEKGHHQLKYALGHTGLGVAFSSGYGDGTYPVFARKNKDGRIVEVRIVMG